MYVQKCKLLSCVKAALIKYKCTSTYLWSLTQINTLARSESKVLEWLLMQRYLHSTNTSFDGCSFIRFTKILLLPTSERWGWKSSGQVVKPKSRVCHATLPPTLQLTVKIARAKPLVRYSQRWRTGETERSIVHVPPHCVSPHKILVLTCKDL